jgi:hypothetical protein
MNLTNFKQEKHTLKMQTLKDGMKKEKTQKKPKVLLNLG